MEETEKKEIKGLRISANARFDSFDEGFLPLAIPTRLAWFAERKKKTILLSDLEVRIEG